MATGVEPGRAAADPIEDCLSRRVWAVVGASNDPSRWGHHIARSLIDLGYTVYPVNKRGGEILGRTAYTTIGELPEHPDVVDTVVPPPTTENVVAQAIELGVERIWMQPGSESPAAIRAAEEAGMVVVHHACAMVEARRIRPRWR